VDFGRRSSLQSHRHLGAQRLILEPDLVAAMSRDVGDAALIAGVVRLAHGLGLQILATGVTDEEQMMSLRLMGCDMAAGVFLSPRRAPDDFEQWWHGARGNRGVPHRPPPDGRSLRTSPGEHSAATEDLRDEVLTYLAHELRNPLTVIAGSAQLLDTDRERIDPSLHELLDSLGHASTHLSRIIDNLYDLRAAHLGALRVEKSPRDLAGDLRRILAETPGLAERDLRSRIPASCTLAFDRHRVEQVLVNVIGNAVKYTAPGTVIEVDLRRARGVVHLTVRDHGPGVPEGRRHELFRKFARLGNPIPGTGLGLFLSRAIARAHGGDLAHEQPDGPGARFVLSLPVR
jgi:signal transduction histidine kinase